eukprot:403349996
MDEKGYFNKGKMHVKATLESDPHKNFLVDLQESDTILTLRKKIGEIMECSYEQYRNLRNIKASYIRTKFMQHRLNDNDKASDVLEDNDEVLFELESQDLWLNVLFNMYSQQQLLVYGTTEFRINKSEKFSDVKKQLQKFSISMWSKMLRNTEEMFVIESFSYKADEEMLNGDFFVNQNDPSIKFGVSGSLKQQSTLQKPNESGIRQPNNYTSNLNGQKRKLVDLQIITKVSNDCTIGDIIEYRNKVYLKVIFKPLIKSSFHPKLVPQFNTNMTVESSFHHDLILTQHKFNKNAYLTVRPQVKEQGKRSSFYLQNQGKHIFAPAKKSSRMTGLYSDQEQAFDAQFMKTYNGAHGLSLQPLLFKPNESHIQYNSHVRSINIEEDFSFQILNFMTYGVVFVNSHSYQRQFEKFIKHLNRNQSPNKSSAQKSNPSVISKTSIKGITDKFREQLNPFIKVSQFSPDVSKRKIEMKKKQSHKAKMFSLFGQMQNQVGRSKSYKSNTKSKKNSILSSSLSSSNDSDEIDQRKRIDYNMNDYFVDASISGEFVNFLDDVRFNHTNQQSQKNIELRILAQNNNMVKISNFSKTESLEERDDEDDEDLLNVGESELLQDLEQQQQLINMYSQGLKMHSTKKTNLLRIFKENQGVAVDNNEKQFYCSLINKMQEEEIKHLIKPFVISWEEAHSIKLPRIRKANVRSKFEDDAARQALNNNDNENNLLDREEFENDEFFFDSQFGSCNYHKLEELEMERMLSERSKKFKFWLIIAFVVIMIVGVLIIGFYFINPYEIRTRVRVQFEKLLNYFLKAISMNKYVQIKQ